MGADGRGVGRGTGGLRGGAGPEIVDCGGCDV